VIGLRPVCFPGSAWRYSSNALLGYTEMVARLEAEERRLERAVQVITCFPASLLSPLEHLEPGASS